MDIVWDGITKKKTLGDKGQIDRQRLADAAKSYNWPDTISLLSQHPELINTTHPDGSSLYSPLHQAAHGGAPVEVVKQLLKLGAWRTLQTVRGERPVDIAEVRNHQHLLAILRPRYRHQVPVGVLLKLQQNFHEVIRSRVSDLVDEHNLRLPELEPLLELKEPQIWFAVPGMYGGFNYHLEGLGANAKLIAESWCRLSDGSGQRHEITSTGSKLLEEGFV